MITRHSPLGGSSCGSAATVSIREIPGVPSFDLRVVPGSPACAAAEAALGLKLPVKVGQVAEGPSGFHAISLGPDWWLLVGSPEIEQTLDSLRSSLPLSITDVSGQRTVIEVDGPYAKAVLAHLWEQDLRDCSFPVGAAGQGLMVKSPVIVWHSDAHRYRVLVRSSFALHLWQALTDAAVEYLA